EAGEQRLYSDADLLVAPGHVATAEESLAALGYSNADSVTGVDDVGGVVHGNTWIRTTLMIDLHRWLPGSRIAPDLAWRALMARRTWIEVAGHPTAVLDRSGQALHLATHAAQHGPAFGKHLDELALALERWP